MSIKAPSSSFRDLVVDLVAKIPEGRVMTYGQIAAHCGNARAARIVGGIAHYGDTKVPWQRVVNRNGGLASGFPGGRLGHAEVLRQEGIEISKEFYILDFQEKLWQPQ